MEVHKLHELTVMLSTTLSGIVMGLFYDLLRALKLFTGKKIAWLLDLLFWVLAGVIFYIFIYFSNNASLRWYEFVFCTLGAVIYWFMASKSVFPILCTVMRFFKSVLHGIADVYKKALSFLKKLFSPFVNQFYNKRAKTYYKAHKLFLDMWNKFHKKGKNNLKNI
jgi:spore cortex biosynthesis protein YabQ